MPEPAPAAQDAKVADSGTPSVPDALVDLALGKLARRSWLGLDFVQEAHAGGLPLESSGRLLLGPERKVHFQMSTMVAGTKQRIEVICDGEKYWQRDSSAGVHSFEMVQLDEALSKLDGDIGQRIREELWGDFGLAGLEAFLKDVDRNIAFTKADPVLLKLRNGSTIPVYRLEGQWTKEAAHRIAPPRKPDSAAGTPDPAELWEKRQGYLFEPRTCRLYLTRDAAFPWGCSLLPCRMEWLGPTRGGGPDELLLASEFHYFLTRPPEDPTSMADQFVLQLSNEEKTKVISLDPSAFVESRRLAMERQKETGSPSKTFRPIETTP